MRLEQTIHAAVVRHLNLRGAPGLVFFHVTNNPRSARDGARLKRLGVRPGVADLILLHRGNAFALELKTESGRLTETQDEFGSAWTHAGGYWCVARGLEHALKILKAWELTQ